MAMEQLFFYEECPAILKLSAKMFQSYKYILQSKIVPLYCSDNNS